MEALFTLDLKLRLMDAQYLHDIKFHFVNDTPEKGIAWEIIVRTIYV